MPEIHKESLKKKKKKLVWIILCQQTKEPKRTG